MRIRELACVVLAGVLLWLGVKVAWAQGSLAPPGAPAPMMKTLEQIESRAPITNLPCTITSPGSYYLVGDLTGSSGQHGITINADDVTLDLNGFALVGVAGSRSGVLVTADVANVAVRNGSFSSWGWNGIQATGTKNSQFIGLRVYTNSYEGIKAGRGALVKDCTAWANRTGILTADGSAVIDCVTAGNGQDGIRSGEGCTVSRCTSWTNVGAGILVGWGSAVLDCSAYENRGTGIVVYTDGLVRGCVAKDNDGDGIYAGSAGMVKDCVVVQNKDGISVGADSRVEGNNISSPGSAGIRVRGPGCRIDGNNIMGAPGEAIVVEGQDSLIVRNSADESNPFAQVGSASNAVGEIINLPSGGIISNASAWANFDL